MLFPTDMSCNSELNQLMMMNFPTHEELNNLISLPSLQTMDPQHHNNHSPLITALDSDAKKFKRRSCITTLPNQCSDGFGDYGVVMENLKPKKETTRFAQKKVSRGISQGRDHIMAERKRREKLNQRFIALSTLVPDLKKTDKDSVLGGTIRYLKYLQDRVRFLEEQVTQKTIESVMFVKKSRLSGADREYDSIALPEIEARLSGNNVMIRIHCEKRKGVVEKTMAEIGKHKLALISSSVFTFASNSLHLTVVSQMAEGFNMTTKDIVISIKSSLEALMKDDNLF